MRLRAALLVFLLLPACGDDSPPPAPPVSAEIQASLAPDEILALLLQLNDLFAQGVRIPHDDLADVRRLSKGQYPPAVFIDCIDSRVAVDLVFNLGLGSAFSVNVAGNVVNEDVLGSVEYACAAAGSKLVVVLGHTSCGAVKGACDGLELGNLTALLAKIRPAIDSVPDDGTPRTSKNAAFTTKVAIANVHRQVARIRDESPVLRDLEKQGKIRIVGMLYDIATGRARVVDE